MKRLLICAALLALAARADEPLTTSTYPNVKSGDVVQIGDFQFVVISQKDYDKMWVTISDLKAKVAAMNETETGRTALHGQRTGTVITNGQVMAVYADGWTKTESAKANAITPMQRPRPAAKTAAPAAVKSAFQTRREAIRAKRRAALSTTNEVTVTVGGGK